MPNSCDSIDCGLPDSSVPGISRQEWWSGLSFASSGDLSDTGIEPKTPATPALQVDSLQLSYQGRLLRVPWTARRSNQSILKEISPEISLEGMMLKLKLQYFGHLMQVSRQGSPCKPNCFQYKKTLTSGNVRVP